MFAGVRMPLLNTAGGEASEEEEEEEATSPRHSPPHASDSPTPHSLQTEPSASLAPAGLPGAEEALDASGVDTIDLDPFRTAAGIDPALSQPSQKRAGGGAVEGGKQKWVPKGHISQRKLFVGGVPFSATDSSLTKFFSRFGKVQEAVAGGSCVLDARNCLSVTVLLNMRSFAHDGFLSPQSLAYDGFLSPACLCYLSLTFLLMMEFSLSEFDGLLSPLAHDSLLALAYDGILSLMPFSDGGKRQAPRFRFRDVRFRQRGSLLHAAGRRPSCDRDRWEAVHRATCAGQGRQRGRPLPYARARLSSASWGEQAEAAAPCGGGGG